MSEMFSPMISRIPLDIPQNKYSATKTDIKRLRRSITTLDSTTTVIKKQIRHAEELVRENLRADPLLALFRVVHRDSKAFFHSLERALNEISQDSLDDYITTRRLDDWRKLMSEFVIEVPAITEDVRNFARFVFQSDSGSDLGSDAGSGHANLPELPREFDKIIRELDEDTKRLKTRLDEAYTALRADMQFTESRRSISEAKTVTKLTELAFIFIPLSFTCSLFSMSIHELQNGVPVWTFILSALVMAVLAYGVRFVIASDFIADSSRSALEQFWAQRNVMRGEKIPLPTLVYLTAKEVWVKGGAEIAFFLFLSAFVVVPVAVMWTTTRLDAGLNIAMTVFLVLSGVWLAWFVYIVSDGGLDESKTLSRSDFHMTFSAPGDQV